MNGVPTHNFRDDRHWSHWLHMKLWSKLPSWFDNDHDGPSKRYMLRRIKIQVHYTCTLYFPCIRKIWRFVHPRKVIFPEGNARGQYDYFKGEQISYLPYAREINAFFHQDNVFGEFCQMKSFGHLCLQNYYFGTSLELIPLYD